MKHMLEAMRKMMPFGVPLIDAFEADTAEMNAEFDRKVAEGRAEFEQKREANRARFEQRRLEMGVPLRGDVFAGWDDDF